MCFFILQKVELVSDLCGGYTGDGFPQKTDSMTYSRCKASADLPGNSRHFSVTTPLQIGGVSHVAPLGSSWRTSLVLKSLSGCIANLRLNGEVIWELIIVSLRA